VGSAVVMTLCILEMSAEQWKLELAVLNLRAFLPKDVLISQMDLGNMGIKPAKDLAQ
jgi:hypothetical protein